MPRRKGKLVGGAGEQAWQRFLRETYAATVAGLAAPSEYREEWEAAIEAGDIPFDPVGAGIIRGIPAKRFVGKIGSGHSIERLKGILAGRRRIKLKEYRELMEPVPDPREVYREALLEGLKGGETPLATPTRAVERRFR